MADPLPATNEIHRCKVVLRVMVEAGTMEAALAEAGLLVTALAPEMAVRRVSAERYWKIEEYFELVLDLGEFDDQRAFKAATSKLATSWGSVGGSPDDLHALWVHGRDEGFALPSVRFADLQCFSAEADQAASSAPAPDRSRRLSART